MSTQELKRFSVLFRHWSVRAPLDLHDESPPGTESEMLPEGDLNNSNSSATVEWYSVLHLKLLSQQLLRSRASSPLSNVIKIPRTPIKCYWGKLALELPVAKIKPGMVGSKSARIQIR